jgi:hypothetical protein
MNAFSAVKLSALTAVLVASAACGSTSTPTQPDAPVYELKTETFPGNVKVGGTEGFAFTVVNPGDINVAITALAPTSTLSMGIGLGFWDPATSTCVQQLSTTAATLNVAFAASPSSAGEYCVAIFDTGNVVVSSDFTLTVTHY